MSNLQNESTNLKQLILRVLFGALMFSIAVMVMYYQVQVELAEIIPITDH